MKLELLLNFFDSIVTDCENPVELPEDVKEVYDELRKQCSKPVLTETGLQILEFLQHYEGKDLTARDIAEGLGVPSRKISGAMRKLTTDNFVTKEGQNPVIYNLTEKGKNFDIENFVKMN